MTRNHAFCILAAGKGTRARGVSTLHKALLPLFNSTVLSYIIEKCPSDAQIVIAVGYQKDIIKEYCLACHADLDIVFIDVDNYDGPGSGPGYSLNCCREQLHRPFYLCCSDCLVQEPLPGLENNWLGIQAVSNPIHWSTAKVEGDIVTDFKNKADDGFSEAWIGIAGIRDYEVFWRKLGPSADKEFEVVSAFYEPRDYADMLAVRFTWFDTGTSENYRSSVQNLTGQTLGMAKVIDEVTCQYKGRCVKIFGSEEVCQGRMERASALAGLVPALTYESKHVYTYDWVEGSTLYESTDLGVFTKFLAWCEERLWRRSNDTGFSDTCLQFYLHKTHDRLTKYLNKKGFETDAETVVNGRHCAPVNHCLTKLDWGRLTEGIPGRFHGDLQPENVIVDPAGGFHLIDWRDSFAGLPYGDRYYDLAKLNGGLSMCYASIKKNLFSVSVEGGKVYYYFDLPQHLNQWRYYYENWLSQKGYDLYKVRALTALIYLNMSPLHVAPFDELLFNHAKYLLSLLN